MWKCKSCGEELEDAFDRCWNCGTGKDNGPQSSAPVESDEAPIDSPAHRNEKSVKYKQLAALTARYTDAYTVARFANMCGKVIKFAGIILSLVILFLTFVATDKSSAAIAIGILVAIFVGISLFILGVLISAVGQILKACLDSAVNTSPLLSNGDRIRIMSL